MPWRCFCNLFVVFYVSFATLSTSRRKLLFPLVFYINILIGIVIKGKGTWHFAWHQRKTSRSLLTRKQAEKWRRRKAASGEIIYMKEHFNMWCAFALNTTLWCSLVKRQRRRLPPGLAPQKEMKNGKMRNSRKIIRKFHINGF